MAAVKYLEERSRSNGRKIWVVNPPKSVRQALDVGYEQFEVRADAVRLAETISQAYSDYRRGIKKDLSIPLDTVDGLIAFYKTTNEWKKLAGNSSRFYSLMIRTACNHRIGQSNILLGQMQSRNVTPKHADALYGELQAEFSAHRAVSVIKVLRKIWYVGKRHGLVSLNPFERMGLKGLNDREVLWEPDDAEAFIRKSDEMGLWSIGTIALLGYDLCQRPGDMRQLQWKNYKDGVFRFVQEKTGTKVEIPASPRLVERLGPILATHPAPDQFIVLCEATGRPYDRFLYAKYARKIRDAAGLSSELQIRDLRRTGATEMAEAGCTEDELRSVTGHQSRDVLSIYVRPTRKLAQAGVSKRFMSK